MDLTMATVQTWIGGLQKWAESDLLTVATGIQAGFIAVAFVIALCLAKPARRVYRKMFDWLPDRWRDAVARQASELSLPIIWLILQVLVLVFADAMDWSDRLLDITVSLLTAWVVIRVVSQPRSGRVCSPARPGWSLL
jgi:hypothetical protein